MPLALVTDQDFTDGSEVLLPVITFPVLDVSPSIILAENLSSMTRVKEW